MPTVFYRSRALVITDDVFAVWTPEPQVYDLGELDTVHVVHGDGHPAGAMLKFGMVVSILGVLLAWPLLHSPGAVLAAFAVVAAPSVASGALRRLTPRTTELVAFHRGAMVTLFSSTDPLVFGQVKRGLMRAFEARARDVDRLAGTGYAEAWGRLNRML